MIDGLIRERKELILRDFLLGGFAGIAASVAMTAAMRRLHPMLDVKKQYPLPPRQLMDRIRPRLNEGSARTQTLYAHIGYGALAGALFATLPNRGRGFGYGVVVWAVSYMGWIPSARLLSPAWDHPRQRNLLMIAAHLVWGRVLAASLAELEASRQNVFGRKAGNSLSNEPEIE